MAGFFEIQSSICKFIDVKKIYHLRFPVISIKKPGIVCLPVSQITALSFKRN